MLNQNLAKKLLIPKEHLLNHKKGTYKICLPANIPGKEEIWAVLCQELGFKLCTYSLKSSYIEDIQTKGTWLEELCGDKTALLVVPVSIPIQKEHFIRLKKIRIGSIASISTGTDHIDFNFLAQEEVPFFHAPGFNSNSVVEYTLSGLKYFFTPSKLLSSQINVGIIGLGRIGSLLASKLQSLNIPYSAYDPAYPKLSCDLSEVLHKSDIISFHVSLTHHQNHGTYEMINNNYINAMNKSVCIINTSRGKIFTDNSYRLACKRHRCIMDVFPQEYGSKLENYISQAYLSTPHIAGYNARARLQGSLKVAQFFVQYLNLSFSTKVLDKMQEFMYSKKFASFTILDSIHKDNNFLKKEKATMAERFLARRKQYPKRLGLMELAKIYKEEKSKEMQKLDPYSQALLKLYSKNNLE